MLLQVLRMIVYCFLPAQSLWTGDKSGYRWGKRQPVRRRRGDVHGDLSAIVIHLDAQGKPSHNTSAL